VDGPGSAYNSFRKRFLQRSNNGSREISSGGATTSNNIPTSQQQDGGHSGSVLGADGRKVAASTPRQKSLEQEPHDDFSDLLDYMLNNAADVDVRGKNSGGFYAKASLAVPTRPQNPTLGELVDIPAR
jgi:hypothetical protein